MKVFHNDSVTSFLVESESRPGEHHAVDLLPYQGFGHCMCEHYQCSIEPGLKAGFDEEPCKHILAAKLAFADTVLAKMIDNLLTESTRARR